MTLLKWACGWVDHDSVATVAELYFAEVDRCSAIVDENIIRLNICGSIENGVTTCLDGLHNTCVDIATAMKRF